MKLFVMAIMTLGLLTNAFAVETRICLITTDIDAEQTELFIETNDNGDLDTVRLYTTLDSKVTDDEFYPAETAIAEGIVASERDGRKIVVLRPKNFTPTDGGIISLDYLYNGIKGTRKTFDLKLVKVAGKFVLTAGGTKINHLYFIGNRAAIIGTLIGIKEIRASLR